MRANLLILFLTAKYKLLNFRNVSMITFTVHIRKNPADFSNRANERRSGTTRNRTGDTRIFSPLLYQLSYGTLNVKQHDFSIASAKVSKIFFSRKFSFTFLLFSSLFL